jgi:hypothetical protein
MKNEIESLRRQVEDLKAEIKAAAGTKNFPTEKCYFSRKRYSS